VVSRFARDHRLPYEPPSGGFRAASPHAVLPAYRRYE